MKRSTRLSKDDWMLAGLKALGQHGPSALKAEPLARELGTTKGSFYWHFKDVPDFHKSMLTYWEDRHSALPEGPADRIEATKTLRGLAQNGFAKDATEARAEKALRGWAQVDTAAAEILAKTDKIRLDYLSGVLNTIGVTNPQIARLILAAQVGMSGLPDATDADQETLGTLVDLVLALR
ncbi:TetR/AcrR family transcriptional regulator [Litorivita pollutaquae]|uniref:TetR/AcrR family transcriptional regulator n=1 Tax=Litorivita pollutaquae TaxID=2200892 RepID=A0A2V4MXI6_9RHOB|nr:TetR/AcrR family transcriptional regulator [Litorivita pollutaquae]PYC49008.1 TetR/AcrR family transcriptional regulator [Litorivita pollutaquae]